MKGFLTQFKIGPKGEVVYTPIDDGFFRLEYDDDGLIYRVAFVRKRGG